MQHHYDKKNFNVVLERTVRELNGESCIALEEAPHRNNRLCARVIWTAHNWAGGHAACGCNVCHPSCRKIREQGSKCRHISVFIATGRYGDEPQYANTSSLTCEYPTSDTRDIVGFAIRGLDSIWRDDYRYAKAGIMLGDFTNPGSHSLICSVKTSLKPMRMP